jgi:hypothetical protein
MHGGVERDYRGSTLQETKQEYESSKNKKRRLTKECSLLGIVIQGKCYIKECKNNQGVQTKTLTPIQYKDMNTTNLSS